MKSLLKVLISVGIVVCALLSIKLGVDLWNKNVKKYFIVENNQ